MQLSEALKSHMWKPQLPGPPENHQNTGSLVVEKFLKDPKNEGI